MSSYDIISMFCLISVPVMLSLELILLSVSFNDIFSMSCFVWLIHFSNLCVFHFVINVAFTVHIYKLDVSVLADFIGFEQFSGSIKGKMITKIISLLGRYVS